MKNGTSSHYCVFIVLQNELRVQVDIVGKGFNDLSQYFKR